MMEDLKTTFGIGEVSFRLMQQLAKVPKKNLQEFLTKRACQG